MAAAGRSSGAGLRVWTWPIDLGDLDALQPRLDAVMAATGAGYERAYLFNNAGLVGPIAYAQVLLWSGGGRDAVDYGRRRSKLRTDLAHHPQQDLRRDWAAVRKSVDVNVTSFVYLTALFLETFGPQRARDLPSASTTTTQQAGLNVLFCFVLCRETLKYFPQTALR